MSNPLVPYVGPEEEEEEAEESPLQVPNSTTLPAGGPPWSSRGAHRQDWGATASGRPGHPSRTPSGSPVGHWSRHPSPPSAPPHSFQHTLTPRHGQDPHRHPHPRPRLGTFTMSTPVP